MMTGTTGQIFDEYEGECAARDRAMEVYAHLDNVDCTYDDMEMYCISVLDSEFGKYPDGALQEQLKEVLNKLAHKG